MEALYRASGADELYKQEYGGVWNNLGLSLKRNGPSHFAEAETCYLRAIRIDENSTFRGNLKRLREDWKLHQCQSICEEFGREQGVKMSFLRQFDDPNQDVQYFQLQPGFSDRVRALTYVVTPEFRRLHPEATSHLGILDGCSGMLISALQDYDARDERRRKQTEKSIKQRTLSAKELSCSWCGLRAKDVPFKKCSRCFSER
jgi:hypothetical protein